MYSQDIRILTTEQPRFHRPNSQHRACRQNLHIDFSVYDATSKVGLLINRDFELDRGP